MKPTIANENEPPGSVQRMVRCGCGSVLFRRNYRAGGWWEQLVQGNAKGGVTVEESFTDGVRLGREPKTMKCAECGKRIANPDAST